MKAVAVTLKEANAFVESRHRHHKKVVGHKFSVGAEHGGVFVGVAIAGRPVSRVMDDGKTIEILRLCTDGTKNAVSFLSGRILRASRALGYSKLITYTLVSEPGVSLRAAGWAEAGRVRGRSWSCPSRPRDDKHPLVDKIRWEYVL